MLPSGRSTAGDMIQVMRKVQQPILDTGQRFRIAQDSNDTLLSQHVQEMPQANRLVRRGPEPLGDFCCALWT